MSKEPLELNTPYVNYVVHTVVPFTIATFLLYGLYLHLFIVYIQLQAQESQSRLRKRPLLFKISIPFLFIFVTLAVILSTISSYEELRSQTQLEYALGDRESLSQPDSHYFGFCYSSVAGVSVLGTVSLLADFVLLYRAYMLWNHHGAIIMLPMIILLSTFASYIYSVVLLQKACVELFIDPIAAVEVDHHDIILASWASTGGAILNNLVLTTLIVYRVRKLTKVANKYLSDSEQVRSGRLVKVIVGSYLLYGIGMVALLGYVMPKPTIDPLKLTPILALIVGISPTFLVVELDLGSNGHAIYNSQNSSSGDII